jgi:NTP pyrophosphatase (non-canonical NTP hydrolase)
MNEKESTIYTRPARGLDLDALRGANAARLPLYYEKGCPVWNNLSQWSNACLGELGEAANIIKKIERGDLTLEQARPMLAKEFADVQCYLDLLAMHAGVDLSQATVEKFNEVSERVGSDIELRYDHWIRVNKANEKSND